MSAVTDQKKVRAGDRDAGQARSSGQ